jgi:hypothetical protein
MLELANHLFDLELGREIEELLARKREIDEMDDDDEDQG